MKKCVLATVAAVFSLAAACASEDAGFASGWSAGPVAEPPGEVDVGQCLPEPSAWNADPVTLRGKIVQHPSAAKGNSKDGVYNCWYRKSFPVPAEWMGKSVRFETGLAWCDLVVFVNGAKAGVAYDPDGSVEISPFLRFGGENEIKVFASNRGWGTGERGIRYWGRGDCGDHSFNANHFRSEPTLAVRSAAFIDDVYARAVFDGGKRLEVEIEVESVENTSAEIEIRIFDDVGKGKDAPKPGAEAVKSVSAKADLVPGSNVVKVTVPWADAFAWELVPDAKCYVMDVRMKDGDSRKAPFLFGFREVKRIGKEIYLNGHVQRFRGYWQQGDPGDKNDLHKYGYNLSYETHKHWAMFDDDEGQKNAQARAGIAVFSGMPSIYFVHDDIRKDPDCQSQWRRFLCHWLRRTRNMPSIVATSCGVNQICPERNMRPEILGQDPEKGGVVDNIDFAADCCRALHPNCLYFSHADGTEADLSSSNLYFNFTPLQEREEWLSAWATNGILPWYAAEFGAPYYACWFHSRTPQMTEWLAAYYGEKAYAAEAPEMLRYNKDFSKDCLAKTHGGWVNGGKDSLYSFNPLGREYSKLLVYRTNRAWRTFGQNGGIMYLESWKWDEQNPTLERQMQANGDLVTWLAGDGEITDRTHAFRAGETITRRLVAVWDGFGEKRVSAAWRFVTCDGGLVVASGRETLAVRQGEVADKAISVVAPEVKEVVKYRFEVKFSSNVDPAADRTFATVETDAFDIEVYPSASSGRPVVGQSDGLPVALFDPEGETANTLAALGVAFRPYATIDAALADRSVSRLVVGRRALSHAYGLESATARIGDGLKLLVMPQTAEVWQSLGFQVEDMMPRTMRNVALPGLDDAALSYWRGLPKWERDSGLVMKHDTRRGPRWRHTHAVAGLAMLIPQRAGFVPLVRGEFDLSYTTLLKCVHGKGSVTFCTFDFEDRVGPSGCPAATETAYAMLADFAADDRPAATKVFVDGEEARRLAGTLGLDAAEFDGQAGEGALVIAGRDARHDYRQLVGSLGRNSRAYVFANTNLAVQAGLACRDLDVFVVRDRSGWDDFPFAGVGPQHLRFRDRLRACGYTAAGSFKTTGAGLFATDGQVIFDAIDPYQICDRYRQDKDGRTVAVKAGGWGRVPAGERDLFLRATAQSEDNQMRRLSLVFANLGVGAGRDVLSRSLYTKPVEAYEPLAQFNVLGPWPSKNDDSAYMIDTADFPVESDSDNKGSVAEEMAIQGDVQPNPRFRPLGLVYLDSTPDDLRFIDWRPVVKPDENGLTDLRKLELVSAQSFNTCYCVGFLERETDGEITLRFGVDWRGAVWVNGQEVLRTYGGTKDEGSIVKTGVRVRKGRNVITVKAGSGQSASAFYLRISKEIRPGDVQRPQVKNLDDIRLYPTPNPDFDPYEYVYW